MVTTISADLKDFELKDFELIISYKSAFIMPKKGLHIIIQ